MKLLKKMLFAVPVTLAVMGAAAAGAHAAGSLNDVVTTLFGEDTATVDIVILLTILTLLPSILIMLTSFTRTIIVLSFLRNATGMQQTPPNQVLIGLALFLTLAVMGPVLTDIYDNAYVPYTREENPISQDEFIDRAIVPLKDFMLGQTTTKDLDFMLGLTGETVETPEDTPMRILIPAFLLSEIKHAFTIGFLIYIPFIVIDMVVSSTLMAMGMMMLPPAMISLPFKILIFVLVDGWQLVVGTIFRSF
ncbi:MAG: flagellar type III secretion system pore protein FliP [Oscillospiraceae bacterium]|jgi:flagellar biosynthetic protein FliP|nr:flagellar type III secretion system pore protein FliP [Oscillospiraceae bacterium]